MKTILTFGIFNLYGLAALAFWRAVHYVNRDKALEALTCTGIIFAACWLAYMIRDTVATM